jgi:predicted nucleic acid-binding protein
LELALMTALLDTGFMLAVLDADDQLHADCTLALEAESNPLLPDVVLPELAYLVIRGLGHAALAKFLRLLAAGEFEIVQTTLQDLTRAADVLERYADSRIDFVDCMIVAMAERLNISDILTVDQRHFRLFRPRHCAAFNLAP